MKQQYIGSFLITDFILMGHNELFWKKGEYYYRAKLFSPYTEEIREIDFRSKNKYEHKDLEGKTVNVYEKRSFLSKRMIIELQRDSEKR